MKKSTKILIGLILIGLIDIVIPIPILAFTLIYVILERPPWFREIVDDIYGSLPDDGGNS